MEKKRKIELEEGAGGEMSGRLISLIRKKMTVRGNWKNIEDDGAVLDFSGKKLVFTTDSFIVDPLFFPGGDIGKIAVCGTINDLSVMGAKPLGLSLSLVIEEGFLEEDLKKIIASIQRVSLETQVPIVTGDTKVTEKGKLDKIEITTAGVGMAEKIISNEGVEVGDAIIVSGDLGEHGVALLAERFKYKTKIKSDSQPITQEIQSILGFLHSAKDPTRGGLAAILNEMASKSKIKIVLPEEDLPFKKETQALSQMLGIDKFSFPSEGRFVAAVAKSDAEKAIKILNKFNPEAKIIGWAEKGRGVYVKTKIGSMRKIENPRGKLIPRIC